MVMLAIKLYPNGRESNAGHIIRVRQSMQNSLCVEINNDIFYIKKGLIAISNRDFDSTGTNIYVMPSFDSLVQDAMRGGMYMRVIGVKDEWLEVEFKYGNRTIRAWISPEDQCGSPWTTCN